jgi:hypothetical protein
MDEVLGQVAGDICPDSSANNSEIHFAAHLANCVLSHLIRHNESIFPRRKEPWYEPNFAFKENRGRREQMHSFVDCCLS